MKLAREDLVMLLNGLHDLDETKPTISHPSNEVDDLVTLELADPSSSTVRFDTDSDQYHDSRDDVRRRHGDTAYNDLPSSQDYRNAVLASGLVDTKNNEEIQGFLEREGRANIAAGNEPVYAGFDTNLLPWNIDNVLGLDPEDTEDDERPIVNGYVLAEGVRDELQWDFKLDGNDVRELSEAFGDEFSGMAGQPGGDKRQGRLGFTNYRNLSNHGQAEEIACDRGDEAIVQAYRDHEQDRRREVILFSNDRNFVEAARSQRVASHHVERPGSLPRKTKASWNEMADLVYHLAVIFGVVVLPRATVYGVWGGKTGNDWLAERIEVECRSPNLRDELETDQQILEILNS